MKSHIVTCTRFVAKQYDSDELQKLSAKSRTFCMHLFRCGRCRLCRSPGLTLTTKVRLASARRRRDRNLNVCACADRPTGSDDAWRMTGRRGGKSRHNASSGRRRGNKRRRNDAIRMRRASSDGPLTAGAMAGPPAAPLSRAAASRAELLRGQIVSLIVRPAVPQSVLSSRCARVSHAPFSCLPPLPHWSTLRQLGVFLKLSQAKNRLWPLL